LIALLRVLGKPVEISQEQTGWAGLPGDGASARVDSQTGAAPESAIISGESSEHTVGDLRGGGCGAQTADPAPGPEAGEHLSGEYG